LIALVVGIAGTWFVGGHGLDITIGIAIVLAALSLLEAPAALERERLLLAPAAVLLAVSAWFRDISGIRAGFVFCALFAVATLTHADYGVWHAVRAVVPRDGLVFTSLTGDRISGYEGWDYYPGVARRQLYLAGWSDSPLLVEPKMRRARLASNAAVLQGRMRP